MTCCNKNEQICLDQFGCPTGGAANFCPDFRIKRYDTKPNFSIKVLDCNEPINLEDAVVEVSMWATGKLKTAITVEDEYFALSDNIGFQQAMVGDIILIDRTRSPEQMLVVGFDETNYLIKVQRGYHNTPIYSYKRGTGIRIMRILNSPGATEMTLTDILQVDGTTEEDVLTESKLSYEWQPRDTCLPGCYYFEFKLLKMISDSTSEASVSSMSLVDSDGVSIVPSFTSYDETDLGCYLGDGVEWVRRFPVDKLGYSVQIINTITSETLIS